MFPESTNNFKPNLIRSQSIQKRQSGVGLPAAIFLITVLAMIVVALTNLEESSGIGFSHEINSTRAFYAAESGLQIGLNRALPPAGGAGVACNGEVYNHNFNAPGLGGCSVTVRCIQHTMDGLQYSTFTGTGTCGTGIDIARRQIEVRVRQ